MNHTDHISGMLFDFNCESCREEFVAEIQEPSTQNDMLDMLAESMPGGIWKWGR